MAFALRVLADKMIDMFKMDATCRCAEHAQG
jgi:hypothetical protein